MKKFVFALTLVALVSSFNSFAQKKNNTDLLIKVKEELEPLIMVDGKKFDFPMDLIDQSKIESVNVLKGDEAKALYNVSNGVILITTKANSKMSFSIKGEKSKSQKNPLIIIDGKISNRTVLDKLEAKQIEKMDVLKGEMAIEKHNAPNGVIVITTKKE
ncbi:TonB-dependent receptor plug domain-containing protein [Winogradskyella flava]|uniref:TonB-dependent receptor plug domain-containing protein n=1 Tax=Winogradskyella flava TaxID=1884876 RepID=A0A842IQF8_9FLAO|nr:TonB-dependent receptor plug domain-containing protein [Winogradskyella flava]MBC2843964.1 TonB-dependent receptor plug domain-containing protein [Winogradskyella flava]